MNYSRFIRIAFLATIIPACQPKAFFSPYGPTLDPVDEKTPIAIYCDIPQPPFTELGILMIDCKNETCRHLGTYVHRLGANGVIIDTSENETARHIVLIDRPWPFIAADIDHKNAALLNNDNITCSRE